MKLTTRTFAAGATVAGLGAVAAIAMAAGGNPATPAATVEPIAQPPQVRAEVVRTTVHVTKHRPARASTASAPAAQAAAPAPAAAAAPAAATPVPATRPVTPVAQPVTARDDDGPESGDDRGERRDEPSDAGDDHGDDDRWEYEDD